MTAIIKRILVLRGSKLVIKTNYRIEHEHMFMFY